MLIRIGAILFCASVLAGPASAQVARNFNGELDKSETAAAAQGGKRAKSCKGRLSGRYRIYFGEAASCTLEVDKKGYVQPKSDSREICAGPPIGFADVLGGRLRKHAPVSRNKKERCWIDGCVETETGEICIVEAFLGGGGFTGIFEAGRVRGIIIGRRY